MSRDGYAAPNAGHGPVRSAATRLLQRRRGSLILTLTSTLVALAVVELCVRAWLEPPMHVELSSSSGANSGSGKLFSRGREGLYTLTHTGWRLVPNIEAHIYHHVTSGLNTTVRTNSLGLRGPELGPKSAPRILFVGDSITLADYVNEEDTIPALTANILRRESLEVETVNAGVAAIGMADELALFKEVSPQVHPDVVILGYYLNDATVCCAARIPPLPAWLRWSSFAYYFHRALILHQFHGLGGAGRLDQATLDAWQDEFLSRTTVSDGDFRKSPEAFNGLIRDSFFNWGNAWSAGSWEAVTPLLEQFEDLTAAQGIKFAVVAFPVQFQVEAEFVNDYPQQQLRTRLERLQVPFLDLLPFLRQTHRMKGPLYYDPAHPTAETNLLIAQELAKWLKPLLSASGTSPNYVK